MIPRKKILRKMGFFRDQEGIMNRYIREKSAWDPHLLRTRDFIKASFAGIRVESVAILGSGWLLDLPLEEMAERYRHIFLVDIHHPPQIRKKVEGLERVELVEDDLTGGAIEQLWAIAEKRGKHTAEELVERIRLSPPIEEKQADALVSLNLINQLDILLCDFLEKAGILRERSLDPFRSMIQAFHVEWITRRPGCLVTDTVEHNLDREGAAHSRPLLHTDLPEGFRKEAWAWEFDTHGTYRSGTRTWMDVQAVEWH